MSTEQPLWQREFPDFPVDPMPALDAAWTDTSWHNDTCPSFEIIESSDKRCVRLFIDYADDEKRECRGTPRFSMYEADDGNDMLRDIYCGDDWSEVLKLAMVERIRASGFEEWQTGGGCTALVKVLSTAEHVVITECGGCQGPEPDDWMIGRYPDGDWQPEGARMWPVDDAEKALGFEHCLAEALK